MKTRTWNRILSLVLSFLMILEVANLPAFAAGRQALPQAAVEETTVRLTDAGGAAVEAPVYVTNPADGTLVAKLLSSADTVGKELYAGGTLRFTAIVNNAVLIADSPYVPELGLHEADTVDMVLDCSNPDITLSGADIYLETPEGMVKIGQTDTYGRFTLRMTEGEARLWAVDHQRRYVVRETILQDGVTLNTSLARAISQTQLFSVAPAVEPLDENTANRTEDFYALGLSNVEKEKFFDTVKLGWFAKSKSDFHMTPGVYYMKLSIYDYCNNGGFEGSRYYYEMCHHVGAVDTVSQHEIRFDPRVINAQMQLTDPAKTNLGYAEKLQFTMSVTDDQGYLVTQGELQQTVNHYSDYSSIWGDWARSEIRDSSGQAVTTTAEPVRPVGGGRYTLDTTKLPVADGAYTVKQSPARGYEWYQDILPLTMTCTNSLAFQVRTDNLITVSYQKADFSQHRPDQMAVRLFVQHDNEILEPYAANIGGMPPYEIVMPEPDANGTINLVYNALDFAVGDKLLILGYGERVSESPDSMRNASLPIDILKETFTGMGQKITLTHRTDLRKLTLTVDGQVPRDVATLGVMHGDAIFPVLMSSRTMLPADTYRMAAYSQMQDENYNLQYLYLFGRTVTVADQAVNVTVDTTTFHKKQLSSAEGQTKIIMSSVLNGVPVQANDVYDLLVDVPSELRYDDSVENIELSTGADIYYGGIQQTLVVPKDDTVTQIAKGDLSSWTLTPEKAEFGAREPVMIRSEAMLPSGLQMSKLSTVIVAEKGSIEGLRHHMPAYRYRLVGETDWTVAEGGSWTGINLGCLPDGEYEIEASFSASGLQNCPVTDRTAACTVKVGLGVAHVVRLTAPTAAADSVELTVTGVPGAVVEVFCTIPGETEKTRTAGTVLPDHGEWKVTVPLRVDGDYIFQASSTVDGSTIDSEPVTVTCALQAPQNMELNVIAEGNLALRLSWTVPDGAKTLHLYRDDQLIGRFQPDVTTYLDTDLDPKCTYTYYILAENAAGTQSLPVYASGKPLAELDTQPPTAPAKLIGEGAENGIRLNWTRSADNSRVAGYEIYRDGVLVGETNGRRSFLDVTALPDHTYAYTVKALDDSGNRSEASPICEVMLSTEAAIGSLRAEAEHNADGLIIGTEIAVTAVTGPQTGWLEVTLAYRQNGTDKTVVVPMQGLGGLWTGSWTIPEGTEQVSGVAAIARSSNGVELQRMDAAGYPMLLPADIRLDVTLVNAGYAPWMLKKYSSVTLSPIDGGANARRYTEKLTPSAENMDLCSAELTDIRPGRYRVSVMVDGYELVSGVETEAKPWVQNTMTCDAGGLFCFQLPEEVRDVYAISPWYLHGGVTENGWVRHRDYELDTAFLFCPGNNAQFWSAGKWVLGGDGKYYKTPQQLVIDLDQARAEHRYDCVLPLSDQAGVEALEKPITLSLASGKSLKDFTATAEVTGGGKTIMHTELQLDAQGRAVISLPRIAEAETIRLHIPHREVYQGNGNLSYIVNEKTFELTADAAPFSAVLTEERLRQVDISLRTEGDLTGTELDDVRCTLIGQQPDGRNSCYSSITLKNGRATVQIPYVNDETVFTLKVPYVRISSSRRLHPVVLTQAEFANAILTPEVLETRWYSLQFRDQNGLPLEGVQVLFTDWERQWTQVLSASGIYEVETMDLRYSVNDCDWNALHKRNVHGSGSPVGVPLQEKNSAGTETCILTTDVGICGNNAVNLHCIPETGNRLEPVESYNIYSAYYRPVLWLSGSEMGGRTWAERSAALVNIPAEELANSSPEFWRTHAPELIYETADVLHDDAAQWPAPERVKLRVTDINGYQIPFSLAYYTEDGILAAWSTPNPGTDLPVVRTEKLRCAVLPAIRLGGGRPSAAEQFERSRQNPVLFKPLELTGPITRDIQMDIQTLIRFRLEDQNGAAHQNGFGAAFDSRTGQFVGNVVSIGQEEMQLNIMDYSGGELTVYFGWKGNISRLISSERLSFWEDRPDVASVQIDPGVLNPGVRTVRLPYYPIHRVSNGEMSFIPKQEKVVRMEDGRLLVRLQQSGTYRAESKLVLPRGAQSITLDGAAYTDYETNQGILLPANSQQHKITFIITQEALLQDGTYEVYILVDDPEAGKYPVLQFTQTVSGVLFSVGAPDFISTNEVTFTTPRMDNGMRINKVPYQSVTPVGGTYWGLDVNMWGNQEPGTRDRGNDPSYTIKDYRKDNGYLEGAWAAVRTAVPDFQMAIRVDGVPVGIADPISPQIMTPKMTTSSGGRSPSRLSFGVLNPPASTGNSGEQGPELTLRSEAGTYAEGPVYWLSAARLASAGLYDVKKGEIYSFLPMEEPDSYPHVYKVEFFFRYQLADGTFQVEQAEKTIQIHADAPIMLKWDYVHLGKIDVTASEQRQSPMQHVNIRSSADRIDFRKQMDQEQKTTLIWNDLQLYTFRAWFDHPEGVKNVMAVADVDEGCRYNFIPLKYDPDQGCFVGTGQLGDMYTLPRDYTIMYEYKNACVTEDGRLALRLGDMKENFELACRRDAAGENVLPEGWSREFTAPQNGWTLEKCQQVWTAYAEAVRDGELTMEELEPLLDENRRLYYPAVLYRNEKGEEVYITQNFINFGTHIQQGDTVEMALVDDGTILANLKRRSFTTDKGNTTVMVLESDQIGILLPDVLTDASAPMPISPLGLGSFVQGALDKVSNVVSKIPGAVGQGISLAIKVGGWINAFDAARTQELGTSGMTPELDSLYRDIVKPDIPLEIAKAAVGTIAPYCGALLFGIDMALQELFYNPIKDEFIKVSEMEKRSREQLEKAWRENYPDKPYPDGDIQWLVDPSGYVFEGTQRNRLEGVSAVILQQQKDGSWQPWNSEFYDEGPNPNITDSGGLYGWDVLPGKWKVLYEKPGYYPTESIELQVPPPHLDVNISMVSTDPAAVEQVIPLPDGLEVYFNRPVSVEDVQALAAVLLNGEPLDGTFTALDAGPVASGSKQRTEQYTLLDTQVAARFRFTPAEQEDLAPGTSVVLTIEEGVRTYNCLNVDAYTSGYMLIPEQAPQQPITPIFKDDNRQPAMDLNDQLNMNTVVSFTGTQEHPVWTSLTPEVAQISADGEVTPVAPGVAAFTADIGGKCYTVALYVDGNAIVYPDDMKCTVIFLDMDGTELKREQVSYAQSAAAPAVPTHPGWKFAGWDRDFSEVTEHITVRAIFTIAEPEMTQTTVTFRVVNGTWSDGTTADKLVEVTLTDGIGTLAAEQIPTGMIANEGYENGKWDIEPNTAANAVTGPVTYTYSFEKHVPVITETEITFRVVNGSWADGTTADKPVKVTLSDGIGTLAVEQIPTGMIANEGYENGKWDIEPNTAANAVTGPVTYTYSFQKHVPVITETEITFRVVNGSWADGTTADKPVKVTLSDGIGTLAVEQIPTGMIANEGYENGKWDIEPDTAANAVTGPVTYTYSFQKHVPVITETEITFRVVNGSWADGTTADKPVKVTLSDGIGTLVAEQIPTGMIANEGYENGKWDIEPDTAANAVTGPVTYVYRFEKHIPVITKVNITFKIINGTWSDGTTTEKTVEVTLTDGHGTLDAAQVPAGMIANEGYENGQWVVTPDTAENAITGDHVYTYIFAEKVKAVPIMVHFTYHRLWMTVTRSYIVRPGESFAAPAARIFIFQRNVSWSSEDTTAVVKTGEIITYDDLVRMLDGNLTEHPVLAFHIA